MVVWAKGSIEDFGQVALGNALEEDYQNLGWDIALEKEGKCSNFRFGWGKKRERFAAVCLGKHCSEESHRRCFAGKDIVIAQNGLSNRSSHRNYPGHTASDPA